MHRKDEGTGHLVTCHFWYRHEGELQL